MKITQMVLAIPLYFVLLTPVGAVTFLANEFGIKSPEPNEVVDGRGFTVVAKGGLHPGHDYKLSLVVTSASKTFTAQVSFDSGTGNVTSIFSDSSNLEILKPRVGKDNLTDDFTFVVDVLNLSGLAPVAIQVLLQDTTLGTSAVKELSVTTNDKTAPICSPPGCIPDGGSGDL